jgi:TonB family protein
MMGRVVEFGTRKPLGGVPVALERADTAASATAAAMPAAHTAPDGVFALSAPGPGVYRIRIGTAFVAPWMTLATADTVDQREYAVGDPPPGADSVPRLVPGSLRLRYPGDLQARRVEGRVVVAVRVDTLGVPDMATFRVVQAAHPGLAAAVRAALADARFFPAEVGGHKVAAVAEILTTFTVERGSNPPWKEAVESLQKPRGGSSPR